ncbi:10700_t:CDS:1, partial [Funneliformis caledonium]
SDPILDKISVLSVVLTLRCETTSVSVSVDAVLPAFFFQLFFFSGKAGGEEIAGGGSQFTTGKHPPA